MKTATVHQAKTHLSRLLKDVQAGESVTILNGRTPVAMLTAIASPRARRPRAGTRTSEPVRYADDAFRALTDEELKEWSRENNLKPIDINKLLCPTTPS